MLDIRAIPIFKDNYVWVIVDAVQASAVVIDPGDAAPVIQYLRQHQLNLAAILITHHHRDHCGGVTGLLQHYSVPVYGKHISTITGVTHALAEGQQLIIACGSQKLHLRVLEIPGHTLDHLGYYGHNILLCGDTLFSAGCGRVFEGTPEQMYNSLMKIMTLPEDTQVYCTHEYTLNNLLFSQAVEPTNIDIQKHIQTVKGLLAQGKPSLPTTIEQEKKINPFLRCQEPTVKQAVEQQTQMNLTASVDIFAQLREWKNNFVI